MNPTGKDVASLATDDIVKRVLAGETELFVALVRRHQTDVWKLGAALLTARTDTEALVQETFVKAYLKLDQYDAARGDFLRWLRGIARNQVRMTIRSATRESQSLSRYREHLLAGWTDEEPARRREQAVERAVAECEEGLAPAARRALALHYEDGHTVEEVARQIDRTFAATRQLLFRARVALRDCLQRKLAAE